MSALFCQTGRESGADEPRDAGEAAYTKDHEQHDLISRAALDVLEGWDWEREDRDVDQDVEDGEDCGELDFGI